MVLCLSKNTPPKILAQYQKKQEDIIAYTIVVGATGMKEWLRRGKTT